MRPVKLHTQQTQYLRIDTINVRKTDPSGGLVDPDMRKLAIRKAPRLRRRLPPIQFTAQLCGSDSFLVISQRCGIAIQLPSVAVSQFIAVAAVHFPVSRYRNLLPSVAIFWPPGWAKRLNVRELKIA